MPTARSITPERAAVLALRMRRQALDTPISRRRDYERLFRRLQPLATGPYARPGSPPRLVHRARFDDTAHADRLRAERLIVKGRFQGGGIGYVWREDLALYANAYVRPLEPLPGRPQLVLDALRSAGPLTPRQLKDETGLLNKELMPALHRLQGAFLVYEDQIDEDWERSWYEFAAEWPEVKIDLARRDEHTAEVVARLLRSLVFANLDQLRDGTGLPRRRLDTALRVLERERRLLPCDVAGLGQGFRDAADRHIPVASPRRAVFVLHKHDPLPRAHQSEVKRRFGDRDLLQLLWIDGELAGAVCGRWGFRPYDVEDIALELPRRERDARRDEILSAVAHEYPPPRHHILRYADRRI